MGARGEREHVCKKVCVCARARAQTAFVGEDAKGVKRKEGRAIAMLIEGIDLSSFDFIQSHHAVLARQEASNGCVCVSVCVCE